MVYAKITILLAVNIPDQYAWNLSSPLELTWRVLRYVAALELALAIVVALTCWWMLGLLQKIAESRLPPPNQTLAGPLSALPIHANSRPRASAHWHGVRT